MYVIKDDEQNDTKASHAWQQRKTRQVGRPPQGHHPLRAIASFNKLFYFIISAHHWFMPNMNMNIRVQTLYTRWAFIYITKGKFMYLYIVAHVYLLYIVHAVHHHRRLVEWEPGIWYCLVMIWTSSVLPFSYRSCCLMTSSLKEAVSSELRWCKCGIRRYAAKINGRQQANRRKTSFSLVPIM